MRKTARTLRRWHVAITLLLVLSIGIQKSLAQQQFEPPQVTDDIAFMDATSSVTSSNCADQPDCFSCYNHSYSCHWCSSDQQCHARGSIHGCAVGSSCHHDDDKKKNNTSDSCSEHKTCSECALSSRLCHWCAHDNSCHVVGSVYGCVSGVDCFSNDRCKRKEPENLPQSKEDTFETVNVLPLIVLCVFLGLVAACASVCFFMAGGVKGAYEDLADIATRENAIEENSHDLQQPLLEEGAIEEAVEEGTAQDTPLQEVDEEEEPGDTQEPLSSIAETETAAESNNTTTEDMHTAQQSLIESLTTRPSSRRSSVHMQRLYNICAGCYFVTLATVAVFGIASFQFYPKIPEYNVCNDAVAWKSLIENLTTAKVAADFEILITVANPNQFSVALDMGKGSFTHMDAFVGTFDIPPVVVPAMTLTDLMLIAHLSPERWEALSLTTAYYRGKLILDVTAEATIRVPAMFDLTYTAKLDGIVVHVNEHSDRSLCHCPSWDSPPNGTKLFHLDLSI